MTAVPKLLTVPDVQQITGLPRWRIYELVKQDAIPHMRVGKTLRFSELALAQWIEAEHAAGEQDVGEVAR